MSDTPRTDAAEFDEDWVESDFARTLERELTARDASLERLRSAVQDGTRLSLALDRAEKAEADLAEKDRQLVEARKRIAMLEGALMNSECGLPDTVAAARAEGEGATSSEQSNVLRGE